MNDQSLSLSGPAQYEQDILDNDGPESDASTHPPVDDGASGKQISSFWRNRFFEVGLIASMALYYVVGNQNLGMNPFSQVNPLFSLPFLLLFAVLCWYRLPIALALLPLSLPYYILQKTVLRIAPNHNVSFSLAEITLGVCVLVALIQLFWQRRKWPYWLAWRDLRDRAGPFLIPILVFFAVAAFSIVIAYNKVFALRAFREEVLDPLVYLFLVLCCLRSRRDIRRLLGALLASGLIVAVLGVIQFLFFKSTLVLESDGIRRVHVMYGSANSIGLFFDYVLPIGLALAVAGFVWHGTVSWWRRLLAIGLCLPLFYVLYLSQSMGAWVAIGVAVLFIGTSSIHNRKVLLVSIASLAVVLGIALFFYHTHILNLLFATHVDVHHVSTVTKRIYLWQTALNMIHDRPWFGYGMDNWLCYYSTNLTCPTPRDWHYLINVDPVTRISTDLKYEPYLSHPHNVLLHIWVSMGIFGVLAFVAILALFFWLFVRILRNVRANESSKNLSLQWMTLGVGAAMLAAMVQGLGDSAFLEQDLAFCFWMLIAAMLVLRKLSGTPWRGKIVRKS
jgi:O-antigen ligase